MSLIRRALAVPVLAALACPALAQAPPRPPEFRAEVAAVYVDAFVTKGGRPVADLAASQFELRDNGVPQQLRQAFGAIADAMGHRYVLRYAPTGVERRGWHRIEARLRGAKGDVHTRRGYWVGP